MDCELFNNRDCLPIYPHLYGIRSKDLCSDPFVKE